MLIALSVWSGSMNSLQLFHPARICPSSSTCRFWFGQSGGWSQWVTSKWKQVCGIPSSDLNVVRKSCSNTLMFVSEETSAADCRACSIANSRKVLRFLLSAFCFLLCRDQPRHRLPARPVNPMHHLLPLIERLRLRARQPFLQMILHQPHKLRPVLMQEPPQHEERLDRKSTRLNSS